MNEAKNRPAPLASSNLVNKNNILPEVMTALVQFEREKPKFLVFLGKFNEMW